MLAQYGGFTPFRYQAGMQGLGAVNVIDPTGLSNEEIAAIQGGIVNPVFKVPFSIPSWAWPVGIGLLAVMLLPPRYGR